MRINDVSYEHGLIDRMLGCGTLQIQSASEGGHVVLGDRSAGDSMPLFRFGGAAWLVVGGQEKVLAESAAAVLLGEQDQDAAVEQR